MARYGDEFYGLSEYGTDTLVDFDVSPFRVSSVDYNKIFVEWNTPTGDWNRIILVRNSFGFPVTPDDGDLLFEADNSSDERTYVDVGQVPNNSGLIEGRTYYYAVFVRETTTGNWILAGTNLGIAVKNYGTAELMYEYLPAVYRIGNPFLASSNDSEINNDLFNFLRIFAFEHDLFKTSVENIKNKYDPIAVDGRLIPALLNEFGFSFERELGIQRARGLLQNAIKIYSEKGSLSGLKTFVTAFTGFNCDVRPPINLMLDYNNASFQESLGFWEATTNVTLFRGTSTTETPAVSPYAEASSPSNFPNSTFGFLRATATALGDMVFRCGATKPLTRGIPVTPGQEYALTAYIRAKTVARACEISIDWYNRFGQLIGSTGASSTNNVIGSWTRTAPSVGNAPENAYYAVPHVRVIGCAASEVHYFDAFQFEVGSEPLPFADARRVDIVLRANRINLVLNPSFETSLANWYFAGADATLDPTGAIEGSDSSVRMTATDADLCSAVSISKVAVQGGDQNALSAYVKATPGTTARLSIIWYDEADQSIGQVTTIPVSLTLSSWTRIPFTAISPSNAVTAEIAVDFEPAAIGSVMYVDAVLFEKAAFVVDYFDGNTGYKQLGDTVWDNASTINGRSHYYKNREVVTKRLFSVLSDYLPTGTPWAVFVARTD